MNWLLLVVVLAMEYQGCPRLLIGGEVDQEGAVQCITSVRQDSKSLVHASTTQGGKGNERPSYRPELDANVRKKKQSVRCERWFGHTTESECRSRLERRRPLISVILFLYHTQGQSTSVEDQRW